MIIKTFLVLGWLHKVESLKRENFQISRHTKSVPKFFYLTILIKKFRIFDLMHKVESLIAELPRAKREQRRTMGKKMK